MQSISILTLSMIASGALTANRFVGTDNATAVAAGNTYGVTRTDGADGEIVPVDVLGTTLVEAGGVIAPGGAIEVGTGGKAVAKAAGVTVARLAPGQAAAADGKLVEVVLIQN